MDIFADQLGGHFRWTTTQVSGSFSCTVCAVEAQRESLSRTTAIPSATGMPRPSAVRCAIKAVLPPPRSSDSSGPGEAARCSSQGRCLQPGGGSSPADAAVWTPVIVIREKPRQRIEPFIIGVVRALVGPLSLHDLVERLRLAIGLRPERPRALQPYVPGRRRAGEAAAHVAGAVVGQDALDGDALALEVGQSPDKEGGSSRAAFVRSFATSRASATASRRGSSWGSRRKIQERPSHCSHGVPCHTVYAGVLLLPGSPPGSLRLHLGGSSPVCLSPQ